MRRRRLPIAARAIFVFPSAPPSMRPPSHRTKTDRRRRGRRQMTRVLKHCIARIQTRGSERASEPTEQPLLPLPLSSDPIGGREGGGLPVPRSSGQFVCLRFTHVRHGKNVLLSAWRFLPPSLPSFLFFQPSSYVICPQACEM